MNKAAALRRRLLLALGMVSLALALAGLAAGSDGFSPQSLLQLLQGPDAQLIVGQIRAPRTAGAWLTGALLGLAGALAQGLFRNPLADPFLLGSASGASLGVALALVALGASPLAADWLLRLGLTGAAFVGAVAAVLLTLALARGVQHTFVVSGAGAFDGARLLADTQRICETEIDFWHGADAPPRSAPSRRRSNMRRLAVMFLAKRCGALPRMPGR